MDELDGNEIFLQHGVILKRAPASFIADLNKVGILSIVRLPMARMCFEWKMSDHIEITDTDSQESGWSLVETIAESKESVQDIIQNTRTMADPVRQSPSRSNTHPVLRIGFGDLKGIEVFKNEFKLIGARDAQVHSSFIFQHGDGIFKYLERQGYLKKCPHVRNFYAIYETTDHDKLQRSFAELNIEEIRNSKSQYNNSWLNFDTLELFSRIVPVVQQQISPSRHKSMAGVVAVETKPTEAVTSAVDSNLSMHAMEELDNAHLPERQQHRRNSALTSKQWEEFKAEDGRIIDADAVRQIIYKGGVEPSIRADVWRYLLKFDNWDDTTSQREHNRMLKTQEYYQMKRQWLSMSKKQEANFSEFRDRKCQCEKDVKRTDRAHIYFAGDDNPNLTILQDILFTYIMYNFDLGYVQGMSDLLAPILCLIEKEAEAFWCFAGFMDLVFTNFDVDQAGMKRQLKYLNELLLFANPRLHFYFKNHDSDNMYFCFRWLLVWFKREFSSDDILELWEVLWTGLPCANYHLFVCVAILDEQTNIFIDNDYEFNEILKHINELSGRIDLRTTLERAEAIYVQVKNSNHLTDSIRVILGENVVPVGEEATDSDLEERMEEMAQRVDEVAEEIRLRKLEEACDLGISWYE